MFCSKCGKEVKEGVKFCPNCGEKAVESKEKVEAVKVAPTVEKKAESSGLGIAGMVMGIVSLLLSWLLTLIIIIVPVVGLILSCCAKGKKGFKITGIVTNALAIVACIFFFIVYMVTLGSIFGTFLDENADDINNGLKSIENTIKSEMPYGTWTCVGYDSINLSEHDYENIKDNNDKEDLTVLKLNSDGTYQYGPYVDSYKNYYKGTFTYDVESDKNEQYKSQGYSFIMVKGPINNAMIDGVKKETSSDNKLEIEMELFKQYGYDKALIIFPSTYNMYMCER